MIPVHGCSTYFVEDTRFVIMVSPRIATSIVFVMKKDAPRPYSLLSIANAKEIIDLVAKKKQSEAKALYEKSEKTIYGVDMNHFMLEDMVPDNWYDVWHEMKGFLRSDSRYEGMIDRRIEEMMSE